MENNNLSTALAKAQATMQNASRDEANSFYKSKYASLSSIINASRSALTDNGLSVSQFLETVNDETFMVTQLRHSSGEMIYGRMKMMVKDPYDMKSVGSAISYLRRYGYTSICCIATSEGEDDGVSNSNFHNAKIPKPYASKGPGLASEDQIISLSYEIEKSNSPEEVHQMILKISNVSCLEEMTIKQASDAIAKLKSLKETQ